MPIVFFLLGLVLLAGAGFALSIVSVQVGAGLVAVILVVGGLLLLALSRMLESLLSLRRDNAATRADVAKMLEIAQTWSRQASAAAQDDGESGPAVSAMRRKCRNCGRSYADARKICECGMSLS